MAFSTSSAVPEAARARYRSRSPDSSLSTGVAGFSISPAYSGVPSGPRRAAASSGVPPYR